MMNRRKLFSFLATAPVAATLGVKAAMDANGNDVAPLMRGDFYPPTQKRWVFVRDKIGRIIEMQRLQQEAPHKFSSQRLGS